MTEDSVRLVAIDPGEHIGFAFFIDDFLKTSGMFRNKHDAIEVLFNMITEFAPDELIVEDYRLYPWKAMEQSWSQLDTPRLIGIIEHWAWKNELPLILQPATAKQAFPDARLEKMDMYVPNNHTRDAIRHGLYRIRFGRKKNAQEK